MVKYIIAALVLATLCPIAAGGPVRDWFNTVRPGVIVPKPQPMPSPIIKQPVSPCPGGQCPKPDKAYYTPALGEVLVTPEPTAGPARR